MKTKIFRNCLMKKLFISLFCLAMATLVFAETEEHREAHPHQFSIGLGDSFMEAYYTFGMNLGNDGLHPYTLPHMYLQYEYRANKTLAVGGFVDAQFNNDKSYAWVSYKGGEGMIDHGPFCDHRYTNLSVVPTLNFTYINRPKFSMHSGFGIGYMASFSHSVSEDGWSRRDVDHNLAVYLSAIGFTIGDEKIYCGFDLGGLTGMTWATYHNADHSHTHFGAEWLFGRILSVSIGFRK